MKEELFVKPQKYWLKMEMKFAVGCELFSKDEKFLQLFITARFKKHKKKIGKLYKNFQ